MPGEPLLPEMPGEPLSLTDVAGNVATMTQGMDKVTKVFASIGRMMQLRERDAIYGDSKESKEYFVNEHEKKVLRGKPVPVRKLIEVARAYEEVLTHTLPGDQNTPIDTS